MFCPICNVTNFVVDFLVYHILGSDKLSFVLAVPATQVEYKSGQYSTSEIKKEWWRTLNTCVFPPLT